MKEIMEQFGVENEGDLKEKLAQSNMVKVEELKDRIDAELQGQNSTDKEEHSPRQNEESGAKADSNWELDSGTHDLATDPLQQIMSAAANAASKGQSRSTNFLELANTVSSRRALKIMLSFFPYQIFDLELCIFDMLLVI